MRIGIFDSGMGGLVIMRAILERLPQYDYVYFGDTANLPYGSRSADIIYKHSRRAMDFLFDEQNCAVVIIACNTASISALEKLQGDFPGKTILGMVEPTVNAIARRNMKRVGLVATGATAASGAYEREMAKISDAIITPIATPLIVPLVENDGEKYAYDIIADYIKKFSGANIDGLVLGCTHYPIYKNLFAQICKCPIISQDDIIPEYLENFLNTNPQIKSILSQNGERIYTVSDLNPGYLGLAERFTNMKIPQIKKVTI